MKIVRSIQGIVSLGRLKSESVERERNVDFMLNNNPGGIERRRWDAQQEAQFKEKWQGDWEKRPNWQNFLIIPRGQNQRWLTFSALMWVPLTEQDNPEKKTGLLEERKKSLEK